MVGFLVAFWATPTMTLGHLLFALVTTVYILVALQLEERDLSRAFGEAYEHYRRHVPMFVPRPAGRATGPAGTARYPVSAEQGGDGQ
jgi:protein-S-isoprenylcysteine O-methyltransferase Ste14